MAKLQANIYCSQREFTKRINPFVIDIFSQEWLDLSETWASNEYCCNCNVCSTQNESS